MVLSQTTNMGIQAKDIFSEVKTVLLYAKLRKLHRRTPKEIDEFVKRATRVSFISVRVNTPPLGAKGFARCGL